jgi:hypothetical protein
MDRGRLQMLCAPTSPGEAYHGYERRNVPKEDKPVVTPR